MKSIVKWTVDLLFTMCSVFCLFTACKKDERPQTAFFQTQSYLGYTDLAYGGHERQYLDIYIPKNKTGKVGVYFAIHGGGWMAGDKSGYKNELIAWCEQGYIAVAINYRYASIKDGVACADILDDITLAMWKVKEISKENGLDAHKALLTGGSAGGHLSMQYAYQKADIAPIQPAVVWSLAGPTNLLDERYYGANPLKEDVVKMFKNLCGYEFDDNSFQTATPLLKQSSPIIYATENSAPTILCYGKKDDIVPFSNGQAMAEKLTELGVAHEFIVFENSGHGLEADLASSDRAYAVAREYAERYLA